VLGDGDVLEREAARSFGDERKRLSIGYFSDYASDYFVVQNAFRVKDQQWVRHMTSAPAFAFGADYGAGISIYRPLDSELPRSVFLPIQRVRNDIGTLARVGGVEQLELWPSRTKAGYALVFPSGYRVAKGSSEFDFRLGTPLATPSGIDPQAPVARFDVTRECSRVVTLSELGASPQHVIVACPHEAPRRIFPRVYWFGKVPMSLVGVSVKIAE
jgi:hypothetical protein